MKYSIQYKKEIIADITKNNLSVVEVSLSHKIPRKTIYEWLKNKNNLTPKYRKGKNHPKYYRSKIRSKVISAVVKNANLTISEFAEKLKVGRHTVYNTLVDLKLTTEIDRLNFCKLYKFPRVLAKDIKLSAVRRVINGERITKISKDLNIARKTLYAWTNQYKKDFYIGEKYVNGYSHPKSLGKDFEMWVLSQVCANPNLSVHALAKLAGKSSHGVYNLLKRKNLTLNHQRITYSLSKGAENSANLPHRIFNKIKNTFINFLTPNLSPAPPPANFMKFFFFISILSISVLYIYSHLSSPGSLFASISLACGMLFFMYSFKYYITLAITLSHPPKGGKTEGPVKINNLEKYFFKYFKDPNTGTGLNADIGATRLSRYPFISVQIPLFNEKSVVERAIKAAANFKYAGEYEVMLCDDSTDQTSSLITKYQKDCLFKNEKLNVIKGDGWSMTSVEIKPGVVLKHLHRSSRRGFKGAALSLAMKLMNPKTEYVSVFDADFVPYSDSLELFLKYFETADNKTAVVQGYQWHVLNKSENWITRGVRSEYAGSYVVERSGAEIYGGLKQISGSVYMIKRDVLEQIGWGTSITEDFELTLKLYEKGYKVLYTPYIQAPAECASTLKRLVGQRMRWAEGHSFNIKKMFLRLMLSSNLTLTEKIEFLYLSPYYLQALFFIIGTLCWLVSEMVFKTKLPFWTEVWGWSLILTNMFALPLVNAVGLFMEESENKDYLGLGSFFALSYILVPFQAYAAVKGFLEKEEGPWFRTPKTGKITDFFTRSGLMRYIAQIIPNTQNFVKSAVSQNPYLSLQSANNTFNNFKINSKNDRWLSNFVLSVLLLVSFTITIAAPYIPVNSNPKIKDDNFISLAYAKETENDNLENEIITEPLLVRKQVAEEKYLEHVFHPEPRVRTKLGAVEIEMKPVMSSGLTAGNLINSYRKGNNFTYENVYQSIDLRYQNFGDRLLEEYIVKDKTAMQFDSIDEEVRVVNLILAKVEDEIQIAPIEGGTPLFYFSSLYMYEENNPDNKNYGLEYELEKTAFGYIVKKILNDEGKAWVNDPNRSYPIVIDPTLVKSSIITSAITDLDSRIGNPQRKITYSPTANGGASWYVINNDGADINYSRCLASSLCDENGDWSANTVINSDPLGNKWSPSLFHKSDSRIYVSWIDDTGGNPDDTIHFRYIDTTTSFPHTMGTDCENPTDQGTYGNTMYSYIAVGTNDDVVIGYQDLGGAITLSNTFEFASGADCATAGNWVSIESGSGIEASSADVAIGVVAIGNSIHFIYEDNATNDLRHSVRDVNTNTWDSIDNDVDGADNIDEVENFSVVTDGTDIWVLAVDGSTATDLFRCSSCPDSSPTWISTDAVPFSSATNLTEVSLSYVSTSPSNTLIAFALMDSSEQAYFRTSDADTISWSGTTYNLGYTAGALANLGTTMSVSTDDEIGIVVWQDDANDPLAFSTLPENIFYYLIALPVICGFMKARKRKVSL